MLIRLFNEHPNLVETVTWSKWSMFLICLIYFFTGKMTGTCTSLGQVSVQDNSKPVRKSKIFGNGFISVWGKAYLTVFDIFIVPL